MKRLIKKGKLGRPPESIGDIEGQLRQALINNPTLFESQIKELLGGGSDFEDKKLEDLVNNFSEERNLETFRALIENLTPRINQAIDNRKRRAGEIIRQQDYQTQQIDNNTYQIYDTDDGDTYKVDLLNETCTCLDYQRLKVFSLWCKHIYAMYARENNLLGL